MRNHEKELSSDGSVYSVTTHKPTGSPSEAPQMFKKDQPMTMIIGLDVHSKKTVYVVQNEEGKVIQEGAVSTSVEGMEQMLAALNAPEQTRIRLETGISR